MQCACMHNHKCDSACNFVPSRKLGYDILGEPSPVPSGSLCPAEKLHWKLSTEVSNDILTAKKNLDEYVNYLVRTCNVTLSGVRKTLNVLLHSV